MIFYLNNFNVFSLFCIRLYKKNKIIKYWRLQTVRYIILLKYEILLLNNIKINLKYTINIYIYEKYNKIQNKYHNSKRNKRKVENVKNNYYTINSYHFLFFF